MRLASIMFAMAWLLSGTYASAAEQSFEGIVTQMDPLEVKSLNGEVRQFTRDPKLSAVNPKKGNLVQLVYETVAKDKTGIQENIIRKEIEIAGATLTGTVKEIAADKSWLVIRTQRPEKPETEVNVPLQTINQLQPLVTAMRSGDGVQVTYTTTNGINSVKSLDWQSKSVARAASWWSLLAMIAGLWILAFIFTKGSPTQLFLGADNRYSTSKFQTVLWFWIVIGAYMAIVFHRIASAGWSYIGGVDIPPNLLILSGISVLTFVSAKVITIGKVEQASMRGEVGKSSAAAPRTGDLIQDDLNRTDLGDYQMVVITILVVVLYAIATVEFMQHIEFRRVVTMPDVDATLLAIFGLGQAAYLGKKAAGDGMTSDQAVKTAVNAADTAKGETTKAATATQSAKEKEDEAKTVAAAVTATKAAGEL